MLLYCLSIKAAFNMNNLILRDVLSMKGNAVEPLYHGYIGTNSEYCLSSKAAFSMNNLSLRDAFSYERECSGTSLL